MENNGTFTFRYIRPSCECKSKYDLCRAWRPPPFPNNYLADSDEWKEVMDMVKKNKGFQSYSAECPWFRYPDVKISTTQTITSGVPVTSGSKTEPMLTSSFPPINKSTSIRSQETSSTAVTTSTVTTFTSILTTTPAATAGGTIALIVILVLVILIALVVLFLFLWKRQKKRTGSINSLPMEKYENTNYLDSKARANHSWNQSQNQLTTDLNTKPTNYGSLPPLNGGPQYVNAQDITNEEVRVESPREFDKMNNSMLSEKIAYDNENFDKNGEESPGANSQTPLFDTIDGAALPNVPSVQTNSLNNVNQTDEKHDNGVKLPPIDMAKTPVPNIRSPKKKKQIYLQRQSCPDDRIEEISKDMAGNRKSF